MIRKNMKKLKLGIEKMSKLTFSTVSLMSILTLTGCSCFDSWGAGDTYLNTSYETEVVAVAPTQNTPTTQPALPTGPIYTDPNLPPDNNDFVNFHETQANYREFGERTPRDQRIVTASAGSNLSASIPPTIDEEVTAYEEEIRNGSEEVFEEGVSEISGGTNEDPVEDWLAEEGNTLKGLLTEWSERSGWRLIWNTNRNYKLSAGAMFRGRYADVASALIRSFARARPAPVATFYKGNRVLLVETMEDENAYN